MATLAVAKDAMRDYAGLSKPIRDKVDTLFEKFRTHTHAGVHLEKLANARDPRLRTVRVDQFWRGLVLAPDSGDTYVLVRIVTHDDADRWAPRHVFKVNLASGALEVLDLRNVEESSPRIESGATPLLAGLSDEALRAVGVDDVFLPMLRVITEGAQLNSYLPVLPELQQQAIALLLAGFDVEEVLDRITGGTPPETVDPDDIAAALIRPASANNFLVTADDQVLRDALDKPFDVWRVFLHPQQRAIAYRSSYSGPARVTGGAGTGKTVVAIHRARHLVDRDPTARVLLTTFTTTLADGLKRSLTVLGGAALANAVDVSTVDALARAIVGAAGTAGREPIRLLTAKDEAKLWSAVARGNAAGRGRFTPRFLHDEWQQVVLAQDLTDLAAYLTAPRPGRGVRLSRADRELVWRAIEHYHQLSDGNLTTLQIAQHATRLLRDGTVPVPYDHGIVDEAQDLHPAQWRLLRAAVAPGPDDLFIVGDAHQRIYDNRASLASLGINVRGRAHRLTVSYRITAEILTLSTRMLAGEPYDDLDDGLDPIAGFHSPLHGLAPDLEGLDSRHDELAGLVSAVRLWQESGIAPDEIAVLSRTNDLADEAAATLKAAGLPVARIRSRASTSSVAEIQVLTMHRAKGLEFRCVALHGVNADVLPLAAALTPVRTDAAQHRRDMMRERSLLFVACTRARDALRISWSGQPSPFLA